MKMLQKNCKPLCTILVFILIFSNVSVGFAEEKKETIQPRYVSIDFNDVDIRVFIKFISELTNENFVIDNKVRGKVDIISPGKITVNEAYKVFESVLEVHGFTTVKAGEITKIIPATGARSMNVETKFTKEPGVDEDKIVTQLIPLKYADPNTIKQLFSPLVSKGSVILAYTPTNTLIITDIYSNINRLVRIIDAIDVKDVGRQISVIPVEYADSAKLEKTLNTLFRAKIAKEKNVAPDDIVTFIADERTNTIIVLAKAVDIATIKELIAIMDKEVQKSEAKIRVYYLENARAEELATVIQSLSGKVPAKEAGKETAPVVSEEVKITADKATNSLIIMADKDDYLVLESVIKKLDIPRPMVYIEALIMEVRETDDFSLGVEWRAATSAGTIDGQDAGVYGGFTKESASTGISALPTLAAGNSLSIPGGFAMGIMAEAISIGGITFPNLGAAIKALKKNELVHILSTPQIMTTDNEEAEISVGENIPYKTSTGTTTSVAEYTNFEYKDVGVTLKITPQISQERFVRLNIYQKVEKLSSKGDNTPTTLKRTAQTTVVVKDAATVVIGGLIGEDLNSTDYQVPCLGGIPIAGNLFKSTNKGGTKTNLFIFLTPHIIQNPAEAEKVYQEKHDQIFQIKEKTINLYKDGKDNKDSQKE
jgi:general secretion pathway protein D